MSQAQLIESLKAKVAKVIDDNRTLREQAARLRRAEEKLRVERSELRGRVAELEHRIGVLELSGSMGGNRSVQEEKRARARVNRLMREVDKCIALASKQ